MSSDQRPLVVVIGATGQQGGSVVTHLLKTNKYRIRGVTRKPNSETSVSLTKKGVEMVEAHADSLPQLSKAFEGAYAVYGVTNFWDPELAQDASKEITQGKNLVDAAVAAHVRVFVWSSLHDAESSIRRSNPAAKWDAHHFTSKNVVEKYLMTKPLTAIFVYAGFYCNNFEAFPPFAPTRLSKTSVEWALPLRADVGLPMLDVADTGLYVARVLAEPETFKNRKVLMATEYLTTAQIAAIYQKVTGESARGRFVPMNPAYPDAIVTSYRWFNEFGYYEGEDVEHGNIIPRDKLTSWEQYLRNTGWRVGQQ